MNKLIILDRDGVINQDSLNYIKSPQEFIPLPGSIEAIARLSQAGFKLAIATNQSGIERGLYNHEMLNKIHQNMLEQVHQAGGKIDVIEYCPHKPEVKCACRKPKPGMLLAIAERLQCSLKGVPFLGDRVTDIEAAESVGAQSIMILSSMTDRIRLQQFPHVPVFHSLAEFTDTLLHS